METKNTLSIVVPLWKRAMWASVVLGFFMLCLFIVADTMKETRRAHFLFDNPDSGITIDNPAAYYKKLRKELIYQIGITLFFGGLLVILVIAPRTILLVDEVGITPYFLRKKYRQKILWGNIDHISPVLQSFRTKYGRQRNEFLGIYFKEDTEFVYDCNMGPFADVLKDINSLANNTLSDRGAADVLISLQGLSAESVIEKIRPYIKGDNVIKI
jgi:hypothetical protein